LRYLVGYDAVPLERLTALVIRPGFDPVVISPLLEKSAATASPIGELGLAVQTWTETQSPFELLHDIIGDVDLLAVDGRMWADKLIKIQSVFTQTKSLSANPYISALRMVKSSAEVEYLREAGNAIDQVHSKVSDFLKVGRTEAEVGADIAQAILDAGHVTVDFVIVGSGPNSASPHHEVSDRVIQHGDAVVVDLGGTMPSGYCSDSTRTYSMGEPTQSYARDFEVLHEAQLAATAAVKPGVTCESIDATARKILTDAGIGDLFIHRIGHGIGLETHEDPYMVSGNQTEIEIGFAFSIEPGFYREGVSGARIEDIVVCGPEGAIVLNNRPRELKIIE
jgi:Xaa-Pro aminopeptidase